MADVIISDYPTATLPLTGSELLEGEQSGGSCKFTVQDIATFVAVPAPQDAIDVPYDNTSSGLVAVDTQAAIDEIATATGMTPRHLVVAYRNAALNSPAGAWAVLALETETADTGGIYSTSTYRVTPTIAGWYEVTLRARTTTTGSISTGIYKNGALALPLSANMGAVDSAAGTGFIYCDGATDYIQPALYTNTARVLYVGSGTETYFHVYGPIT